MEIIVKLTHETKFEKFGQNVVIFKDFYIYVSSKIIPLSSNSNEYCLARFQENSDGDNVVTEIIYASASKQRCEEKAKQLNMYF